MKSIIRYLLLCICAMNCSLLFGMQPQHKLLAIDETTPEVAGLILYYTDSTDKHFNNKYIFGKYTTQVEGKDKVVYSSLIEQPYTPNVVNQFQDKLNDLRNMIKSLSLPYKLSIEPAKVYMAEYSFVSDSGREINKKYYLYKAYISFAANADIQSIVVRIMQSLGLAQDQYSIKSADFFKNVSRFDVKNKVLESIGTSWGFSKNFQFPMVRGFGEAFLASIQMQIDAAAAKKSIAEGLASAQKSVEEEQSKMRSRHQEIFVRKYTPEQSPLEGLVKGRPGERILKPSIPQGQQQPNTPTPESELIRNIFGIPAEGEAPQEAPKGEQGGSIFEAFFSKQPAQPAAQPATPPAPTKVKVQTPAPQVPTQTPAPVVQPSTAQQPKTTAPKPGWFAWLFGRSIKSVDGSLNDLTTALNDLKDAIAKL